MTEKIKLHLFVVGTLFGIIISFLFLMLGGWWWLANRGVTVYLDSNDIASVVEKQVIHYASRDLPLMIDYAKAKVPGIIKSELRGQVITDKIEIAGFVFSVPPELVLQVEKHLQNNVKIIVFSLLEGIDTELLSQEIGVNAAQIVKEEIRDSLHEEKVYIPIAGTLSLPVKFYVQE